MATLKLHCYKDNNDVEIDINLAMQSETIKNLVEDFGGIQNIDVIPLEGVECRIVANVFSWVSANNEQTTAKDANDEIKVISELTPEEIRGLPLQEWERSFFDQMSMEDRFNFLLAANYLDVEGAKQSAAKYIADEVKGKTPEELRRYFNVPEGTTVSQ